MGSFISASPTIWRGAWRSIGTDWLSGFTKKYGVKMLVYYETFDDINAAIHRESRLKKYKREWKLNLVEAQNVEWRDLTDGLT